MEQKLFLVLSLSLSLLVLAVWKEGRKGGRGKKEAMQASAVEQKMTSQNMGKLDKSSPSYVLKKSNILHNNVGAVNAYYPSLPPPSL